METLAASNDFYGTISDLGGPTANMYGTHCKRGRYRCPTRNCLTPEICPHLDTDHAAVLDLMAKARKVKGVKHVFVQSGIRFDLALSAGARDYIEQLARHHVSGRLKIAPEHVSAEVLHHMHKPPEPFGKIRYFQNRHQLRFLRLAFSTIPQMPRGSAAEMIMMMAP
jgi:radical SAM superfamily enzyme YgiQ (UPF0313 family)